MKEKELERLTILKQIEEEIYNKEDETKTFGGFKAFMYFCKRNLQIK